MVPRRAPSGRPVALDPGCLHGWRCTSLGETSARRPSPGPPLEVTQADLASPAPRECFLPLVIRADNIRPEGIHKEMRGYLPRFLPGGFGFLTAWSEEGEEYGPAVIWTDDLCRQVMIHLVVGESAPERRGPRIGEWTLLRKSRKDCAPVFSEVPGCLTYSSQVRGGELLLNVWGLERPVVDRIALSVSL